VEDKLKDILQRMNIQQMREEVIAEELRRVEARADVPEILYMRNTLASTRERILDLARDLVRLYGSQLYNTEEETQ
jgi:hypothetical protein